MVQPYEGWLNRKLAQPPMKLRHSWTMTRKWERVTGGRILFGELTLVAEPSQTFSYTEEVVWPTDYPYFRNCVLDGILDGVFIDLGHSPTLTSFILKDIRWHDEYSVPRAYRQAAREAIGEIFCANEQESLLGEGPREG